MTQVLPRLDTRPERVGHPASGQYVEPVGGTPDPNAPIFLVPADWEFLRAMRLAALQNAPEAFVTTYAVEQRRPRNEWVDLLTRSRWVAARKDGKIVGIACLAAEDKEGPEKRFIESVWVTPGRRRQGLVRRMLEKLEDQARREGADDLQLWVLDTNDSAADAYVKLGFVWADRVQDSPKLWPDGKRVKERFMVRPIADDDLSPQVVPPVDHIPPR
jgi:ribosomal protein S18 acetylase RimI-like enzyme